MRRIVAVVVGLSLAMAGTSATIADTINVPADQPTIEAAITASASGDVILIAAGTYYEANLTTRGRAITVQGTLNEDGSLATTIDAQQGGRVFRIGTNEGSGTVIRDLIITGGSEFRGGGIYCFLTSPTIRNCTITDNSAQNGSGIYSRGVSPTIIDCRITNNSWNGDQGDGAGIYLQDSLGTISGCTISGNTVTTQFFGGRGGGIYCTGGSPTITGCTISNNSAAGLFAGGGGIASESGSVPIISKSELCGNQPNQINGDYDDAGGNTVADECPAEKSCPGDVNLDGLVDAADLGVLIAEWNCTKGCSADLNEDGLVDSADLGLLIAGWGFCNP